MQAQENEYWVLGTKTGEGFPNKCHLLLISTSVRVKECAPLSVHFWGPELVPENLTEFSGLSVSCFQGLQSNWPLFGTYITSHLCLLRQRTLHPSSQSGDGPLDDIEGVLNSLRSRLRLLPFFFVNHGALPVTSLLFSVLCCCWRQHELTRNGTEKS